MINWKEIIVASLEVAGISALTQFVSMNEITWEALIPVLIAFVVKFGQELNARIKYGTSSKNKKVPKFKTLFFKKY